MTRPIFRLLTRASARGVVCLRIVASFVVVFLPVTARAQGSVAGVWKVEFPRRVENDGSGERVTEFGHARVIFEIKGDSVIGSWKSMDGGPSPAVARRLAGTMSEGKLHLISEPFEAVMRGPDGETHVKLVGTYELTIDGDTLAGTQHMKPLGGGPDGPTLPVKGTREKA